MFVNNVLVIRQCRVICNNERSGFSQCRRFVFKYVSTRGTSAARCICVVRKALS